MKKPEILNFNNKDFTRFMLEAFEQIDEQKLINEIKKERIARGQDPYKPYNDGSIDNDKHRREK
jgi:hypothetical protein